MINRILSHKFWLLFLCAFIILINILSSYFYFKIDLTEENRYSLSKSSKKLLNNLEDNIQIEILLDKNLPSEFQKLKNGINDLFEEMNDYANIKIKYTFINPLNYYKDSTKDKFLDTLYFLGVRATNISSKNKAGFEKKIVYPGAIVRYKNKITGINFLSETLINSVNSLNNAEALLEYKITNAIEKITSTKRPAIAFGTGNEEPLSYDALDLFNTLLAEYKVDTLNLKNISNIPYNIYDALLIVKPLKSFDENEKLKIDQFVLNGGNVLFFIDNVFIEMADLQKQKQVVAQNINLNLDDLLFHFGARINYDLIEDVLADKIPLQIGWNGDKPQFDLLSWYFFPLLNPNDEHPITKNIDNVVADFASTISLTKNENIKQTILLNTSQQSKKIGTPTAISLNILNETNKISFVPVSLIAGVLLESKYKSFYANRLTDDMKKKYELESNSKIINESNKHSKIIIVSDADIILNKITDKEGPLLMGMNPYTKYQHGNKIFFQNCIEYLTSKSGIIENRNKNFTLRNLDKKRIESERLYWQSLNIIVPIIMSLLMYFIYFVWRWRKYSNG